MFLAPEVRLQRRFSPIIRIAGQAMERFLVRVRVEVPEEDGLLREAVLADVAGVGTGARMNPGVDP